MNLPMNLEIWTGDWGLPSIDTSCLEILTYGKFSGAPLHVHVTNNPFRSQNGHLPVFRHNTRIMTKGNEIIEYLKNKNYDADFTLTDEQKGEIFAFTQLIQENLYPALQYNWWISSKNYMGLTRPRYAQALPFPFNYYYPGKYERIAKELINSLYDIEFETETPEIQESVYSKANKCLNTLSARLGDRNFLFGDSPRSLDATLFAYLAPLLKTPFPDSILQNHLKGYPNLIKYVDRILRQYYPNCLKAFESKKKEETKKTTTVNDPEFYPHKRRNQFIAAMVATFAMATYGVAKGIIQFDSNNFRIQHFSIYKRENLPELDDIVD